VLDEVLTGCGFGHGIHTPFSGRLSVWLRGTVV
jgi:hypothetical protein